MYMGITLMLVPTPHRSAYLDHMGELGPQVVFSRSPSLCVSISGCMYLATPGGCPSPYLA
jgi:hypothetical protein